MFSQAATSAAAHSGGSVIDRKYPPGTQISACAAISALARASSSGRAAAGALCLLTPALWFSTATVSLIAP